MESKQTSFILIIIVAVLTLALAALAGYLFIVQGSSNSDNHVAANGQNVKDVPKEADLIKIPLYENERFFNLKSTDPAKTSVIQVKVTLKCYKTLKHDKKAIVSEMISSRSEEIQELVVRFFLTLTADQVKDPAVMDKSNEDLKKQINSLLNEGNNDPEDVVYKVVFSEWLFQ